MKEWRLYHAFYQRDSPLNSTLPLLIISQTQGQICSPREITITPFDHVFASVTESLCVVSILLLQHTGWSQGTVSVLLAV